MKDNFPFDLDNLLENLRWMPVVEIDTPEGFEEAGFVPLQLHTLNLAENNSTFAVIGNPQAITLKYPITLVPIYDYDGSALPVFIIPIPELNP